MTRIDGIDLHAHSNVSDGTDPPYRVVELAAAHGVTTVALTDHDIPAMTTPASQEWARAVEVARDLGVTIVPGSEISCHWWLEGRRHSAHLLALLFRTDHAELSEAMERVRRSRQDRMTMMVERLHADHPVVDFAFVRAHGGMGDSVPGRPHLARALMHAGLVTSMDEAFSDRWLGHGGPYYVRKASMQLEEAVGLVREAGGVSVLAHPARAGYAVPEEVVARVAVAGLDGIEVDHPWQSAPERLRLRAIAQDHGLLVTGGSDFHGTNKADGLGAQVTGSRTYAEIIDRVAARGGLAPVAPEAAA